MKLDQYILRLIKLTQISYGRCEPKLLGLHYRYQLHVFFAIVLVLYRYFSIESVGRGQEISTYWCRSSGKSVTEHASSLVRPVAARRRSRRQGYDAPRVRFPIQFFLFLPCTRCAARETERSHERAVVVRARCVRFFFLLWFYRARARQAPATAMPPCVWGSHTPLSLLSPPAAWAGEVSVRPSGPARARVCMRLHLHIHAYTSTATKNITKTTSPSLSSLLLHTSLLSSWKPTQVTHLSLSLLFSLFSCLLAWCKEKIAPFPLPISHIPASLPPYLLFCPLSTTPQQVCLLARTLAAD